ncbi:MAG: hypothetical protein Q9195_003808 [Heterodermia aff. obscurata]
MDMSYRIDEGYSEETRSQDDLESPMRLEASTEEMVPTSLRLAMDTIMSLEESDKCEFVYNVLQTLRTSSIAHIVERLRPHLHKDPVAYLPPEVTSEIFSYLTPSMLLEASSVSRAWRERTLDGRLWKRKFHLEGWELEVEEVRRLEETPMSPRKTRTRRAETHGDQRRHKKRIRPGADVDMGATVEASPDMHQPYGPRNDVHKWNEQQGAVEADINSESFIEELTGDQEMRDIDNEKILNIMDQSPSVTPRSPRGQDSPHEKQTNIANSTEARRTSDISMETEPPGPLEREPPLIWYSSVNQPRLNYQQLYKQRRKLEENWNACQYKSFQLPHRDHPEEAHGECVYTIQYIGRYLVSGSRDRTLRKWDLETQRLIGKPMLGHSASVLCLQFDNSKEEDIIMSGSSDTSVLIWRYSTGELLERIDQAHREPVLNLKFDSRFLVTCSKDKTIKIWNRQKLSPGDRDYPIKGVKGGGRCPSYIVDLSSVGTNPFDIHKYLRPDQREPLREYTSLMTLDSHSAAVNAIHIFRDQLVSASGDRYVKVWNIHTGECISTCRGHTKGIACVQYDGKRIISGSSDNTIRIYDPVTQAEVACLQGHTRLVRTIQSAFEDLPGSKEELQVEAEEVDKQFFLANGSEELTSRTKSKARNPGSNQPKNITAIGAKLPPGGGGSRWGRIVSGSYDETIIIWRKGLDGRWVAAHRLRQEEALRAAGGPLATRSEIAQNLHIPPAAQRMRNIPQASTQPHGAAQANTAQQVQPQSSSHQQQFTQPAPNIEHESGSQPRPDPRPRPLNEADPNSRTAALLQQTTTTTTIPTSAQHNTPYQAFTVPAPTSTSSTTAPPLPHHHQHRLQPIPTTTTTTTTTSTSSSTTTNDPTPPPQPPPPPPPQLPLNIPHPHHHHPAAAAAAAAAALQQPNARVFKLQFDARRIICCSQDPKIVGWDFANGDERVVEASRFFGAPL